ncbi:MAG: hypothetical protein JST00_29855 [Deltaproteobacteria bacterium]|nr:hypothetical protein [Deltaproteobacteria bacterium]
MSTNTIAALTTIVLASLALASLPACSQESVPETAETEAPLTVEIPLPPLPLLCSSLSTPACAGRPYGSACPVGDGRIGTCDSPWKPVPWHQLKPPQVSGWDCNTCVPPAPKAPRQDIAVAAE